MPRGANQAFVTGTFGGLTAVVEADGGGAGGPRPRNLYRQSIEHECAAEAAG